MGSIAKLFKQNIIWRGLYYLLNIILSLTIARYFQASISGTIFYVINNCAFITLLLSISFESAIIFFASGKEIKLFKLFHFAVLWITTIAIILCLVFLLVRPVFLNGFFLTHYSNALLFIVGNIMTAFMGSFYYAQNKFILPNLISIGIGITLLLMVFFINENGLITSERFLTFYFASFLVQGLVLFISLLRSNTNFIGFSLLNRIELSSLFKYLSLVFFSNLIIFFCFRIDYWFVNYYCSSKEMGNYILVSKMVQLFFVFPGMLTTVLYPLASSGAQQKVKELIPFLTRSIFLFYSVACFILIIIGKWFFPFVFGNSFSLMYTSFLFYIPGIIGFSALHTFATFYSGRNQVMINLKGCSLALIVVILGDLLLIPKYGINAAAAVSSCGYLVYFLFVLRLFIKEFSLPLKDFFLFRKSDWGYYKSLIKERHI